MSTIRWSPYSSIARDLGSTTVVFGLSGSGKTFFLINLAMNEIAMGRRIIAIDAKNDFYKIKRIHNQVDIVDVNNIRAGALNPFTFFDDVDSATIITIIELLTGKLNDEKKTSITPIIQDFVIKFKKDGEYKDMTDVANYLFSKDDKYAQSVGTALKLFEDSKYGKLLFTKESDVEPLQLSFTSSLVISLFGMALPSEDKDVDDYTSEERLTSTVVYLLTRKLRTLLQNKVKIPTVFFFDEAHLLFSNKEMSRLIDEIMSLGRSLKTATVLATQGADRFPDITRYVTSKFMFKNSLEEAEKFLERYDSTKYQTVGAIDTISVATRIAQLEKGVCFFIDSLHRSGFIKIIPTYNKEDFD